MFKKLRQKIELEGSPSAKEGTGESASNKNTERSEDIPTPVTPSGTDNSHSADGAVSLRRNAVESVMMSTDNSESTNNDMLLDNTEPTPRRKNLAATVLMYGEEISAKNKLIAELEQRLAEVTVDKSRWSSNEQTTDQLRERVSEQEETIRQLVLNLSKVEASEVTLNATIKELETQLSSKGAEVRSLTQQLQAANDTEADLQSHMTSLKTQLDQLSEELQEARENNSKLSSKPDIDTGTNNRSDSDAEVSELKLKLKRAHSHSKQLELQLSDKETFLTSLVKENRDIKSSLENSKQQALDDLLSVSKEESGLRAELSSLAQKHTALQSQHKTQSRLLSEKQGDMVKLEETIQQLKRSSEKKRQQLVDNYTQQIAELERSCQSLRLSLTSEIQSAAKVREQLDSLREEALDKQLDDEKQLGDLHEQLSGLRGDIRQLERSKKKEIDLLNSELSVKSAAIERLDSNLSTSRSEHELTVANLNTKLAEMKGEVYSLTTSLEECRQQLAGSQSRLEMAESERDDLYLRNADLSSRMETCKIELKSALSSHEQDKSLLMQRLQSKDEAEVSSQGQLDALQEKITLLEGQVHVSDEVRSELETQLAEVKKLKELTAEQEKTIAEKTKSLRIQQQTINDLKKTIKRELKDVRDTTPTGSSQELIDRVRSSPALSDLDRYDSPAEDTPPPPSRGAQANVNAANSARVQQYRHEVNGFCGHKDINFEYLKNVVFSFLVSRDSESLHLIKALAVLLEFTQAEERLLKETLEWKMSWWPSAKKPSKKVRK